MVECSSERRSNARSDPSAPTDTKTSVDVGSQATSYYDIQARIDELKNLEGSRKGKRLTTSLS
jgi:hypothetical protein